MIVTSFQDFKLHRKEISQTYSYFLINNALLYHFLANLIIHNKKMTEKSGFEKKYNLQYKLNDIIYGHTVLLSNDIS